MGDPRSRHLSDLQLASAQDGDLPLQDIRHLDTCPECSARLNELKDAVNTYMEYRDTIRGPALPPVPKPWKSLDSLIAEHRADPPRQAWRWWLVPALAAAVGAAIFALWVPRSPVAPSSERASELLARSARAEFASERRISMRVHGRTLVRPAVLATTDEMEPDPDAAHLRRLFIAAKYSWRAPMSATSFQSWRSGLAAKTDTVSVIRTGATEQAYRVRTDTSHSLLRSASLTLRAKDLVPTSGAFQFADEDPLQMEETPPPVQSASPRTTPPPASPAEETPAGPADTLRVLAALDEIGADVGEPIDVSVDAQRHRVIVRATGLSADRRQQVAEALRALPRVELNLDATLNAAGNAHAAVSRPAAAERYSSNIPGPLRQQFESRLGGSVALQDLTDRVLEVSGSALARAHAIEVLAKKFPPPTESLLALPDRELLRRLLERHLAELRRLTGQMQLDLKPLLSDANRRSQVAAPESWQAEAPALVALAQQIDDSLNPLLAGSYSPLAGEGMLRSLAQQLDDLDRAVRLPPGGGR